MRKIRSTTVLLFISIFFIIFAPLSNANATAYIAEVYLGGYPIAIEMLSDGPIVSSVSENYALSGEIKTGDVIKSINGRSVSSCTDIGEIISDDDLETPLRVCVLRYNSYLNLEIMPEKDVCSDKLKLGFATKEGVSGVGTMTFVTKDGKFYALGHSIKDGESTSRFVCRSGEIYKCEINGIKRPDNGRTGKLIGRSVDCGSPLGEIEENSLYGLHGTFYDPFGEIVSLMPRDEIKPGKAQIRTTLRGEPAYFDIEIIKASKQSTAAEKGMVIHVTDAALINNAGGILQGMSGSPILQNGKLVGAVTHVFTNDPTRGYGVYADWMLTA